jgi:hypothetical protein
VERQQSRLWIWSAYLNGNRVAVAEHPKKGPDPFLATVDDARHALVLLHRRGVFRSSVLKIVVRDVRNEPWAGYEINLWHR